MKMQIQKGFTIVEVLVAVSIFLVLVSITTGYLMSALGAQRQILQVRPIVDEISFVGEYLSRAMRTAHKSLGSCGVPPASVYEIPLSGDSVIFIDRDDKCREIRLVGGVLEESIDSSPFERLTSQGINVAQAKFVKLESGGGVIRHARLTISLIVEPAGGVGAPQLRWQTTISQRRISEEIL